MADPADDAAAFREAVQRAEEAAGITRDDAGNEHASGETPVVTPELPEAVPVQASDQPLTPEPVAEAPDTSEQQPVAPAEPAAPAEPQSVEELQAELALVRARLEEKDSFIGRQSGEVGELRGMVDELKTRIDAQTAQPAAPQAPQVAITQDLIDNNPGYAVQAAFEQKNEQALAVAFEAWKDMEPFEASTWLNDRRREQETAVLRAELEATRNEVKSLATPLAESAATSAEEASWHQAFTQIEKTHPDFREHAVKLLEEVAPAFPHIARMIAEGDATAKVEGLTLLYDKSRLGNPEQVRADLEREAADAAAEADAARQGAQVVSQTTVGQPGVEKTPEKEEADRYIDRMGNKPSLERGWTGRA